MRIACYMPKPNLTSHMCFLFLTTRTHRSRANLFETTDIYTYIHFQSPPRPPLPDEQRWKLTRFTAVKQNAQKIFFSSFSLLRAHFGSLAHSHLPLSASLDPAYAFHISLFARMGSVLRAGTHDREHRQTTSILNRNFWPTPQRSYAYARSIARIFTVYRRVKPMNLWRWKCHSNAAKIAAAWLRSMERIHTHLPSHTHAGILLLVPACIYATVFSVYASTKCVLCPLWLLLHLFIVFCCCCCCAKQSEKCGAHDMRWILNFQTINTHTHIHWLRSAPNITQAIYVCVFALRVRERSHSHTRLH